MSTYEYSRRQSWPVQVGKVALGGDNPVRVQSMTNTSTMDTEGSAAQSCRIAQAGGDIVRLTAQGVREARNLGEIHRLIRQAGCDVPLVADIHFNPKAAFEAANHVEKVRINPGNFVDPGRTFVKIEYTDEEYAAELQRIDDAFSPFLKLCKERGVAVRIGVNHGSLSDRIMSRYGDTPAGMVESAMEFLRVAMKRDFRNVVISIKSSNTAVMVQTVRLLVQAMDKEGMHFPLHLGVTEAGDGEDGRVRSAVGIGTLLAEGIGDTVRVSLSEEPEAEIPVARELVEYITSRKDRKVQPLPAPESPAQGAAAKAKREILPVVVGLDTISRPVERACATDAQSLLRASENPDALVLICASPENPVAEIRQAAHFLRACGRANNLLASLSYPDTDRETTAIRAAADFGPLLLDGIIDGLELHAPRLSKEQRHTLALGILQAARRRVSKTEFVSCPGCGRTMFDLQSTVKTVKEATAHLPGLKIAVMGCIVNGPGEMADADYGYVGAAAGKISLYRGKQLVEKNIPSEDALHRLVQLLQADGRWQDAPKS